MAEKPYLVHINLNKNQLLNALLQNLGTAPTLTTTDKGFIYYNTSTNKAMLWTGTAWVDLSDVYTHPTFNGTAQPASALTGAQVISQVTLNNGHVTGVVTRALTPADIGASSSSHSHNFTDILGLPTQTILGNNTGTSGPAQALTVADLLTMLSIAYGNASLLTAGTDTGQRTWSAKMISDYIDSRLTGYITAVNLSIGVRTTTTLEITNSAGTGVTLPSANATQAGLLSSVDKTKLDGVEAGANNYIHPTDNPGPHPFATELTTGLQILSQLVVNNTGHVVTVKGRNLTAADIAAVLINNASNVATTQTWSSSKIYTEIQSAINQAQTGALQYKGEYDPGTNTPNITLPATGVKTGWTYVVSANGTFAGQAVESGDMIIAKIDNPGSTPANWQIVNKNIPAIVSATTTIEGIIFLATVAEAIAGTNNTKAITPATLKAVLDASVGGYSANFGDGSTLTFTITHGLNTQDVLVSVQRLSDRKYVEVEDAAPSSTTVTLSFNVAPANNSYRVIIKK